MKNIKIIGKAGIVEFPKEHYNVDDFKITPDAELGYFNLGGDNFPYVSHLAPVFATEEHLKQNRDICIKSFLVTKIEVFINHYRLPYSDHNVEKLAKFALDHCPYDTDILDFIDPDKFDNMYDALCDILQDGKGVDAEDREFIENVDDIVHILDLDYGSIAVNRLLGWIKNAFDNASQDYDLIHLAFLQRMANLIKSDIPHFEHLIHSCRKLNEKLLSDGNLAFDTEIITSLASFETFHIPDTRNWNKKAAEDFIDNLNCKLIKSSYKN